MSDTIKVSHIAGAIDELAIPVEPGGGITVIKGVNGAGKDSALDAVARFTGGSGPLEYSDGHPAGWVDGFGAHLSVARSTRLSGQLEVTGLSGLFDLSEFVDPLFKDPAVADAHRIKKLLALRGTDASPEMFWPLFGGKEAFESAITLNGTADLVEMARLIKAEAEKVARGKEAKAEHAEGQATACAGASSGLDMTAECDAEVLQAVFEHAIGTEAAAKQAAESNRAVLDKAAEAEEAIAKREVDYTGLTAAAAMEQADAAMKIAQETYRKTETLRKQLAEAVAIHARHENEAIAAAKAHTAARGHEATIAAWRETIAAARGVFPVSEDTLAHEAQAVRITREAVETGALIRQAHDKAQEAAAFRARAADLRDGATALREAGRATDSVLSKAVASDSLWVEGGRLMSQHARGAVLFHILSKGEKWVIAILEAVKRIRELAAEGTAIIVIPQQAWEGLDPVNRRMVWQCALDERVTILVGQCDGGALRAEIYDPDTEPADTAA